MPYVAMPPAAYVHPYPGPISMIEGTQIETQQRCEAFKSPHAAGTKIFGCMIYLNPEEQDLRKRLCVLYLATDLPPQAMLETKVHEVAHCNGWKHN